MGSPLRFMTPDVICFISNRCVDEKLLLTPGPEVNALILACLVRAAKKYRIELMGYVFMGNHFHLIVRARWCNIGDFMRDFQSWLVIKMKKIPSLKRTYKNIDGFFPERYHQVDVLDDEKAFEKLIYTLVNPCASHLVERPEVYPGVSSLHHNLSGEEVVADWLNLEQYTRNHRRNPKYTRAQATTRYTLELTPLPMMEGWTQERRARAFIEAIDGACQGHDARRGGRGVLGPAKILGMDRLKRPAFSKKSRAKTVVATDEDKVELFLEHKRNAIVSYYKTRKKELDPNYKGELKYPPGLCRPGCAHGTPYKGNQRKAGRLGQIFGSPTPQQNLGEDKSAA